MDNPSNKYEIFQTIGNTIGGGVRGDCFRLEFKLELKNLFIIAFPINGCRIKNTKNIILPIILFYILYLPKKIEI